MKKFLALVLMIVVLLPVTFVEAKAVDSNDLKGKSRQEVVDAVGALFTADYQKTDVLASVSMAQFLLETGFGQSELFLNANNGFGMQCNLQDVSWSGSTWDGKSKYKKNDRKKENGKIVSYPCEFRKYSSFSDSIADHSAYVSGAKKKDGKLRYGIKGVTDYKSACKKLANGGYGGFTPAEYEKSLINIIKKYDLTKYDKKSSSKSPTKKTETKKETVKVNTSKYVPGDWVTDGYDGFVNYRKEPNTSSKIMGKYYNDTLLSIVEVKGTWGKVRNVGYWVNLACCYRYASKNTRTFKVVDEFLNVRSGHSTSYKVVGRFEVGEKFTPTEFIGSWGRVEYSPGKFGWTNTAYAKEIK